ncbi:MAG: hypothetical protein LUH22_07535 [Bacteroides sp.]|nr:hypothetical protein [Bacteroides sp.]
MSIEYAIIVKNKTRLESLTHRFNTKSQAKFYIQRNNGNFDEYEEEHEVFHQSLSHLQAQLSKTIKYKIVERSYLPSYIFSDNNLVIVTGQDGLVANTAKYTREVPMIAVNPDPQRYDGVLLPFTTSNFMQGVEGVLRNQFQSRPISFAEAKLNDGQRLLAFNDLFIGASSHISARYRITYNGQTEEHSSSGIIVSTQAGSTGWLSSIFNMAYGISRLFVKDLQPQQLNLNPNELLFTVREPFKSLRTQADMAAGFINSQRMLQIESLMPSNGVIFSDGIESDFLSFNSGTIATIGIAPEKANLVMAHS